MSAALRIERVSMRFGGLVALDGIDLHVAAGDIRGLIGPNGAGKTTLFNIIAGLHRPTSGRVHLGERDVTGMAPERLCALGIARTFQVTRPFAELSVLDNAAVGALREAGTLAGARRRASEILEFLELEGHADKPASALSVGLRKRLEVARALATRPSFLLLDEVMGGLHGGEVDRMIATIRRINETGVTVVLIEHVMPAIMSLAKAVTVLDQGRIIASGTPAEVTENPEVIRAYLGDEFRE